MSVHATRNHTRRLEAWSLKRETLKPSLRRPTTITATAVLLMESPVRYVFRIALIETIWGPSVGFGLGFERNFGEEDARHRS